ncbi:DUF1206 domain-containing protein [Ktedonosporobacter rubrisoli]|uniref:DUF1206 domain-containing protein n=2 Tax=Ktedonosporobacter rubrisoli TaxID=2509675 RepID=A0A4P6K5E0_KTERU|nr:DUF1206 domain-containing protein [Ktedonosporobacter rubrisoli]
MGYAAKGVVYILIGFLAIQLAIGQGGSTTDRQGALHTLYTQPFGQILLAIVTLGLIGFALWSFIQAIFDADNKGSDMKGIFARIGFAGVGISYAALAFGALQLVLSGHNDAKGSTASTQSWTALLLDKPFGVALVVLIGLFILGLAGFMFFRAYKAQFKRQLNLASVDDKVRKSAIFLGRFGNAAHGVVFAIIGLFLIIAALQHNPGQAKGLDSALQELAHQPFGAVVLGIVALGLMAYGAYSLVEARYRRLGQAI